MLAPKLNVGDTIGIIAPSNLVRDDQREHIDNFVEKLKELGFNVKFGKHVFEKDKYQVSCASGKLRAQDFNDMVLDKGVKAIWCFQGGDTASDMLKFIDFEAIKKNPKIIVGKSDIDLLLLVINKITGLVTFHACDAKLGNRKEFDFKYTQEFFIRRLVEGDTKIEASSKRKCLRKGEVTGTLLGCNISSILKLAGTEYFPEFKGAVLFLEGYKPDIRKTLYKLRQLVHLGVLDKVKGVVVGHIYGDNENFSFEELVFDITKKYNLPLLKVNEFGHYCPHAFLPIGSKVKLDAANKEIEIISDFLAS